jgi:LPS transport system D
VPTASLLALALLQTGPSLFQSGLVQVDADEIESTDSGVSTARGHVVLRSGTMIVRGPLATYDREHQKISMEGPLFSVDGENLLLAHRAEVDVASGALDLYGVEFLEKAGVPTQQLAAADTAAGARRLGRTLMVVFADHLQREGPGRYRLEGVTVTPCDCGADGGTPDWALSAKSAEVKAGDGAVLELPILQLGGASVPLLRVPALYFPLSDRRTGLLIPRFVWQSQNGFILDEPFFATLGRSYDLTFSPGYAFGVNQFGPAPGEFGPGANGVHGPMLGVEFRYAPDIHTSGRVAVNLLYDFNDDFETAPDGALISSQRGLRGSLRAFHLQDFDDRAGLRVDLSLVSDAKLSQQLTTDLLSTLIPATRSAATAFWRGDNTWLSVEAVYLQDFQGAFEPSNIHQLLTGEGSPRTLASLPRLEADLADRPIGATPLRVSLNSSLVREAAVGATYDEVPLGSMPPFGPWLPGRAGANRLDVVPTLSLPWLFGRAAKGSLSAGWRQDLWAFDATPVAPGLGGPSASQFGERGAPILDATVATEMSRTYGGQVRHRIVPEVEFRSIPFVQSAGTVPPLWLAPGGFVPLGASSFVDYHTQLPIASALPLPYDELDVPIGYGHSPGAIQPSLLPGTAVANLNQAVLHVNQFLTTRSGQRAELDLGAQLDAQGFANAYLGLEGTAFPFRWGGYASYSLRPLPCPGCSPGEQGLRRLTETWLELGVGNGRGSDVSASFRRALAAGGPRLSTPQDGLFGELPDAADPRWALPDISQATLNARTLFGALLGHGGIGYLVSASLPFQVAIGGGYSSKRGCLLFDINAVLQPPTSSQKLGLAGVFFTINLGEVIGGTSL